MKPIPLGSVIVGVFVGGAGLGYWAAQHRHLDETRAVQSKYEGLRTKVAGLEAANQKLNAGALAAVEGRAAPPAPAEAGSNRTEFTPIEALRVLADLQQRKLVKPAITFLDRKSKLDPSFVGLFALTPTEQDRLQQAVDDVREKLAKLERANASVTRDERGNIVVAVQAFPEEGGKVYDEVTQVFADVLGPDRNEAYRKVGAEQFEIALGRFGAAERTYTFGYDLTERPGQPYTFQDRVLQRSANGGLSGNTNNTRFSSFDDLVARVGPIVSILPPDYKRAK